MDIKLWAVIPHSLIPLAPANTVWPQCPVLPWDSPAHSTPSGFYSWIHHLSKSVPGIFLMRCTNLHTDPRHHTQPSQGNPQLLWGPTMLTEQGAFLDTASPAGGTAQHLVQSGELKELPISQKKNSSAVEWLASSWSRGHPWAASLTEEKATEISACQNRKNHIHSVGTEERVHSKTFKSAIFQSILSWATGCGMTTASQRRECLVAYQILYNGASIQL